MKFGIFYELQLPRPWEAGGELQALSGRADPGRARRPARLRLRLDGGAPFPRGILALPGAGVVPRRRQPAHQEHPPRPRHPAAHHQPSRARRRARGGARPAQQRALRVRHGRERLDHRARAVRPLHGGQARGLRGGRAGDPARCSRRAAPSITASISTFRCATSCPSRSRSRTRRCGWPARSSTPSSGRAAAAWARSASSSSARTPRTPGCMPTTTPSPSGSTKLADYTINPNIALVSFFMCAKTDEEARRRADGATFFQFALRFYGASSRPQAAGARHRQHVGRVQRLEARQPGGAGGGAARRPDRLARDACAASSPSSRPRTSTR